MKGKRARIAYPLSLFQFIDFLCDSTVSLMDAIAVAAVDFGDFAVLDDHFHHPGTVQLAAVAGNKFVDFHLQILGDAEATGSDDQMISCDDLHIHAEIQPVGGNLPGITTTVDINPEGAALIGAGEADVLVTSFKELDVA